MFSCHRRLLHIEGIITLLQWLKVTQPLAPYLLTLPGSPNNLQAMRHLSQLYHLIICCL